MAVYQRDDYAEKFRKGPGCAIGLMWVAATVLGSVLGSYLIDVIVGDRPLEGVEGLLWAAVIGLLVGAGVGTAQALVLLPYLKVRGVVEWTAATAVGRVLRSVLIVALTNLLFLADTVIICIYYAALLLIGGLAGAVTGYAQRSVLDRRVAHAQWWVLSNAGASALTTFVAGYTRAPQGYLPLVLFNALLFGGITGYVLIDLLRHPTLRAEWTLPWRKAPPPPEWEPGTQSSPEALLEQSRRGPNAPP